MSRLMRDGTAEPVSRDQILRLERGRQGNIHFPCSADLEQDCQRVTRLILTLAICDDHTYIHAYYINRHADTTPNQRQKHTRNLDITQLFESYFGFGIGQSFVKRYQ